MCDDDFTDVPAEAGLRRLKLVESPHRRHGITATDSTRRARPGTGGYARMDSRLEPLPEAYQARQSPPVPAHYDSVEREASLASIESFDTFISSSEAIRLQIDEKDIQVVAKIGEGSTAEVYKARWNGKMVAVKTLIRVPRTTELERSYGRARRGVDDQEEQVVITRELSVLAKVTHDNLVVFYGVCPTSPLRIVTEFCEGGSCHDLLHNAYHIDLGWEQCRKIALDVALAMQCLHGFRPQIVHRDLKSANALLSRPVLQSGDMVHVKVADFGLARMKDPDGQWGRMTNQVGSFHFMAPEVASSTTYDEKVDIYSYSMLLFEVLSRNIPFSDVSEAQMVSLVKKGKRPDPNEVDPEFPEEMQQLMVRCWSQSPADRPSFVNIVAEIRRIP